jgi:hypothetical protein
MEAQVPFYNMITGQTISPKPWQEHLRPGDYYMIENPIIGLVSPNRVDAQEVNDAPVYGIIIGAEDCEPGYFWVRAYSILCPGGEEGVMCIVDPTRVISREEFETARRNGWWK